MKKSRACRFVGGPLHGTTQPVDEARSGFRINRAAALALPEAIGGYDDPSAPPLADVLVYTRRHDGRYYLEVDQPENVPVPPMGFEYKWFDIGEDVLLVEVHSPSSDWGHATAEVMITKELLADAEAAALSGVPMADALPIIEEKERLAASTSDPAKLEAFAVSLIEGTAMAKKLGNRRVAAQALLQLSGRGTRG